jgi:hypothetical protein
MMPCFFNPLVYVVDGRILAVQPDTQIVEPIVDWVTSGFFAPGDWADRVEPPSAALPQPVPRESRLELTCLLLADFDAVVRRIATQPFLLRP